MRPLQEQYEDAVKENKEKEFWQYLEDSIIKRQAETYVIPSEQPKGVLANGAVADKEPNQIFEMELTSLINKYSLENGSDTPDFILAKYLRRCLINFNSTVNDREKQISA